MSNITATNAIKDSVSRIENEAKRAEATFESKSESLQQRVQNSIDLFSPTASRQVASIVADSKRVCDEYYAAFQMLVKMLDDECRPLLEQAVEDTVVKEVYDLLCWLNEESKIENNFSAHFNQYNLGDIGNVVYSPSVESLMIQKFWEMKYHSTTLFQEMLREEELREQRIQKEREDRERRKREAKKAQEKELENIAQINKAAKEHMEQINQECYVKRLGFEKQLNDEFSKACEDLSRKIKTDTTELKNSIDENNAKIKEAGLFSRKVKKELKEANDTLIQRVELLNSSAYTANQKQQWQSQVSKAKAEYKTMLDEYMNNRFPDRNKRAKPDFALDMEGYMANVLYVLNKRGDLTVADIYENETKDFVFEPTQQKISASLRNAMAQKLVNRYENIRKAWFSITGAGERWLKNYLSTDKKLKYVEDEKFASKPIPEPPSVKFEVLD